MIVVLSKLKGLTVRLLDNAPELYDRHSLKYSVHLGLALDSYQTYTQSVRSLV